MSKIKDFFGIEVIVNEKMEPFFTKQETLASDLYASIKEVAELKYRMMEAEVRVSNLTDYIKTLKKEGG